MKTLIKIFICLSLIYTPMFANAATVGGWTLGGAVAQGASTVYDATKNVVINGKNYIKESSVKITPTASQVAKVLARGGAGYALSVAVEQLIGAVDWVLDPENNRIKYWEEGEGGIYQVGGYADTKSSSQEAACRKYYDLYKTGSYEYKGAIGDECYWTNPDAPDRTFKWPIFTVQTGEKEEKYLPLPTAAQQVISNASGGDSSAQQATVAAAADIVAEAETDNAKARPIANQLDANATTKPADAAEAEKANEATGEAKPNTTNPDATDLSLEFPIFCNWAPTVCEAAQTVISFPQTLTGWWESANQKADDWVTSISDAYQDFMRDDDLPNDDTTLDVSEIPTPELQENAISWGASCPADVQIPINLQGVSSTITFSWSPWCQLLDIIKPAIIASAYIGAAFIVLGLRT